MFFRKALLATCGVAVAAAGTTAGLLLTSHHNVVHHHKPPAVQPVTAAPVRHGPLLSPFTGEPIKKLGPVLAVKIDNIVLARPQTGLQEADIIYVLPVEGGLTRFMAIFSSRFPPVIGPVRSGREDDLGLLAQFGRPAYAFSGAQPYLLPVLEHSHTVDLYANLVGGYHRDNNRIAPYNLYADTRTLLREARGASKAHDIGFTFSNSAPAGGRRTTSFTVTYPAATYTFKWENSNGWKVWMDGARAMLTSGQQMSPHTVVIQYVDVTRSPFREQGNLRPPDAVTEGSGRAIVLRNGREYVVHWYRTRWYDGTRFTLNGKPFSFARGQVWIVLVGYNQQSRFNESQ
jgi:hypothetical protein